MPMHAITTGHSTDRQKEYRKYLSGPAWKEKVEAVRNRCNDTCEHCHAMPMSEVHHLTYVRIFKERLEDLKGVCGTCHDNLHHKTKQTGADTAIELEKKRLRQERYELHYQLIARRKEFEIGRQENYKSYAGKIESPKHAQKLLTQHNVLFDDGRKYLIALLKFSKRQYLSGLDAWLVECSQWPSAIRVKCLDVLLDQGEILFDPDREVWSVKLGSDLYVPGVSGRWCDIPEQQFRELTVQALKLADPID